MSLRDIKDGWYNLIKTALGGKVTQETIEVAQERYSVCLECPHLKTIRGCRIRRCVKCGCGFPAVVWAPQKKCPIGKWER